MFTKISNSKSGKFTALLLACVMLFSSFTTPARNIPELRAGTLVSLVLVNEVTSSMKPGQPVDFRVTDDVRVNGVVVIPAGAVAKGQVVSASKNKLLGIPGEVTVEAKSVYAVDGTKVLLSGSSFTSKGNSKLTTSIVLTFLCGFGFLIKGGTGVIPSGTTFEATVAAMNSSSSLVDTTIPAGEADVVVTRDNPGASALEKTIIRWYFDSEPRGARLYWRVVSSVPAQVKNTNESYLGTTPFEETRSFNILGLTYENSRDVQIEVKMTRPGYMDQTKRFNVRQAIDQMEISSFYELVPR